MGNDGIDAGLAPFPGWSIVSLIRMFCSYRSQTVRRVMSCRDGVAMTVSRSGAAVSCRLTRHISEARMRPPIR